jgi:c(7)-type cytochrome triheme protein
MKSKSIVCLFAALAFGLLATVSSMASEEKAKGPESIEMKGPAGKKAPVTFNHAKHQEGTKCGECHHSKGADGKQVAYVEGQKIEKCSACHELGNTKDMVHQNCKGCHVTAAKGPTKCTECHPKKEGEAK